MFFTSDSSLDSQRVRYAPAAGSFCARSPLKSARKKPPLLQRRGAETGAGLLFYLVAGTHFQGVADGVEHLEVRLVVLGVAVEVEDIEVFLIL